MQLSKHRRIARPQMSESCLESKSQDFMNQKEITMTYINKRVDTGEKVVRTDKKYA